jgi:hypothetical protein
MQYFLTQEEFDKLGGNREAMRKEFQAKMDAKIGEFSKALTAATRSFTSTSDQFDAFRHNPLATALAEAVKAAMKKCELEPEPDPVPSVPQRG